MLFAHGQTVTLLRRALQTDVHGNPVRDTYGNDLYSTTPVTVDGCAVWPGASTEQVQGRDTVSADLTVVVPPGVAVTPTDRFQVDGVTYEVWGNPNSWRSPLSGTNIGAQVQLRVVTG